MSPKEIRRSPSNRGIWPPTLLCLLGIVILTASCGGSSSGGRSPTASPTSLPVTIGGTARDSGSLAWPAPPPDQAARLAASGGLQLERKETLLFHVHAHLDIFINGEHRTVPAGIGIVTTDPAVQVGTADGQPSYGGIAGCNDPCISPLHTHDITGVLHTESATAQPNTLGQFFKEWNVRLDDTCVGEFCAPDTAIAMYVDGKATPLSAANALPLNDHEEIAIVIGRPPAQVPDSADFSNA